MNGKELKVAEYNLTFGKSARMINVFGVFKYKPNNNLYIIYTDVGTTYNVVHYGSSHVKDTSALCMSCDKEKTEEIIKEYIFKVTNKEKLDNFEMISLDKITEVEIISSNALEIKKEVLTSLIDLTIPKKEVKEEPKPEPKKKKSIAGKLLIILIVLILLGGGVYYYFNVFSKEESVAKTITCTKTYNHKDLDNVEVEEEQVFNFSNNDTLESVDISEVYNFLTEDAYLDFINMGLYYKYMPEENTEGGWNKDDEAHTFTIITKDRVDSSYTKPTNYEDVFSYYEKEKYKCTEDIVK